MADNDSDRTIVAVPVADGLLCPHFGHCQQFALFEVDPQRCRIEGSRWLDPPPHEPGLLPKWLGRERVQVVITGGIGRRARDIFQEQGTMVVVGAPAKAPHEVVQDYLDGALTLQQNPCDH